MLAIFIEREFLTIFIERESFLPGALSTDCISPLSTDCISPRVAQLMDGEGSQSADIKPANMR